MSCLDSKKLAWTFSGSASVHISRWIVGFDYLSMDWVLTGVRRDQVQNPLRHCARPSPPRGLLESVSPGTRQPAAAVALS